MCDVPHLFIVIVASMPSREREEMSMASLIGRYRANVTLVGARLLDLSRMQQSPALRRQSGIPSFSTYIKYCFRKLYFLVFVLFSRCAYVVIEIASFTVTHYRF